MARNTIQITCVSTGSSGSPYERITHVGATLHGKFWRITQREAIAHLESGEWTFYVDPPEQESTWVVIATTRSGLKYLKAQRDRDEPRILLALPECVAP